MKTIWEEHDILAGLFVCKRPEEGQAFKPSGWTCKWTHKIGFSGGAREGTVLVAMTDGMISSKMTPKECADYLTEQDMMVMPHTWLIKSIDYMRDWYVA